jgi:ABC-type Na+ efflux pump permease subunit
MFVAGQAAAALARDRAEDPLELLLSTPLTAKRLIEGQWLSLRQTLKPLVQLVLWIEIAWMTLTIAFDALDRSGMTFVYVSGSVAVVGFLLSDLRAIGWTALWRGVIARNAREAEQQAFSQVAFLPWLPVFITWVAVASTANPFRAWFASIVCWMLSTLVANLWFSRRSRRLLESRLTLWAGRRAAGEFENYDGWRAAGRWLGRRWRTL